MSKKQPQKKLKQAYKPFLFGKKNYMFMFVGLAFITLGFVLMAGGASDDPNVFNPEIFNNRRIRIAPTLILIGFGIEIYAILLNPDSDKKNKDKS